MPRFTRTSIVHAALVAFAAAIVFRAAEVQILEGSDWERRAQRQHYAAADVPAARGNVFDVSGTPLVRSMEMAAISVAPQELADRQALRRELARLRVSKEWIARATARGKRWVTIPGHFLPEDAAALRGLRGVYVRPVIDRVYTHRSATKRVVGSVDKDGQAVDGLELALDSLLSGDQGKATVAKDARGSRFGAVLDTAEVPVPGDDIVLTINQELQEISERALADALEQMGATGGDIVILDPHSGEIRAMTSRRSDPRSSGSPALSEPFEPGSTIKPFYAARLLSLRRARPEEMIDTENGVYQLEGRRIVDTHEAPELSLADVIRYSSNIGIVKFTSRLDPREQFETLRDFGFGTPTGVLFPTEAAGILRPPRHWSRTSAASLSMGYEVAVTPLQLAAAYASFANGGELLEPALVKEVRSPEGEVRYRHTRRVVRRVMEPEVAETVRGMLIGTVQGGTGDQAALGAFAVAGKTGTARRAIVGGRGYAAGAYTASFVGLFPAERPQYVILVKIDNPSGEYYGGQTAAPVSKAVLEAAIAARDAALDRGMLARARAGTRAAVEPPAEVTVTKELGRSEPVPVTGAPPARLASAEMPLPMPRVIDLPGRITREPASVAPRVVPDVHGMPVRDAVRALHATGFQVRLAGSGLAAATWPSAGTVARQGSLVRLTAEP
jgi:cell division protein FtsI (penicillin-binding protein 3)